MCLLIWIILFNWIILMESRSPPLRGAQTNGEQLASSCDQPLAFIRRQLQALQAAWQGGVPTAPLSRHFCCFPFPPHVQKEPRSQCGPEPGLSVGHEHHWNTVLCLPAAWATGLTFSFVKTIGSYMDAKQTPLAVYSSLPSVPCLTSFTLTPEKM